MKALLFLILTLTSRAAVLAWDPNADYVDGYRIHWGEVSGFYTDSSDAGVFDAWQPVGFTPGVRYYFIVTAYNGSGESEPSEEVSWLAELPPKPSKNRRRPWLDPLTNTRAERVPPDPEPPPE